MSSPSRAPHLHESLLDLVGGTPPVRLRRPADDGHARVYAKLEYLNPVGTGETAAEGLARVDEAGAPRAVSAATGTGIPGGRQAPRDCLACRP